MDDIAIKVDHVSKTFRLPHEKQNSIKGALISMVRGGKRTYEKQEVLKDISFEIKKGEFFGIVGRNGSGKSTLLKMMAGIYSPSSGGITVNGKLTPFIELGVGFNPELTGRENVFLNGALLGFTRSDMEKMYDDIVEFAELEQFMDQKLKNYSSGMQVRLAFSVAIKANTDILLIDEVLAVGDEAFQRKCYEYFEDLKRNKKTVIIVTHDMSAVEKFCSRGILIEKGIIVHEGSPQAVAQSYKSLFIEEVTSSADVVEANKEEAKNKRWGDKRLVISKVGISPTKPASHNEDITIDFLVKGVEQVNKTIIAAYAVKDSQGQLLFGDKVEAKSLQNLQRNSTSKLSFSFPNILHKGRYFIDLSLFVPDENTYTDCWLDCLRIASKASGVDGYSIIIKSKFHEGNIKNI